MVTADGYYSDLRPNHITADKRYITQVMTGVPYGEHVVSNAKLDAPEHGGNNNGTVDPDELLKDPFKERPTGVPADFYEQMLCHNAGLVSDSGWSTLTIRVDVERDEKEVIIGYAVTTHLGSALVYRQSAVTVGTDGKTGEQPKDPTPLIGRALNVRLQNHWDSGVKFAKAEITPLLPE